MIHCSRHDSEGTELEASLQPLLSWSLESRNLGGPADTKFAYDIVFV